MIRKPATAVITAALALGIAAAAGARPFNENAAGSFVPAGPQTSAQSSVQTPDHVTGGAGGGISEAGYLAIGTGGAVVLIGAGGALTASRRRQHTGAARRTRPSRDLNPARDPSISIAMRRLTRRSLVC